MENASDQKIQEDVPKIAAIRMESVTTEKPKQCVPGIAQGNAKYAMHLYSQISH
jgi:hypothetical protein